MPQTRSQDLLCLQLAFHRVVVERNLGDVTDAEALLVPHTGGNPIHWVMGHVLRSRSLWLEAMGEAPILTEAEAAPYQAGSPAGEATGDPLPLSDLRQRFLAAHDTLTAALQKMPDDRLGEASPWSPTGRPDETFGTLAASLLFHEAYHLGQTGVLRRALGKPGAIR
jgi:uncharacterized damage-inducible protein DinB